MTTYEVDADDSAIWQVLVGINTQLRSMTFESRGTDQMGAIQPSGIEIRKLEGADQSGSNGGEVMPGLLVTLPRASESSPLAGTNRDFEVVYPILIQILLPDYHDPILGMRTVTKWQELIERHFCSPNLNLIDLATTGVSYEFTHVTQVFNVDPKAWQLHNNYKAGVVINALVRKTWSEN